MRFLFRISIIASIVAMFVTTLSAQSPAFVRPAGGPLAMLALPEGLKANDVAIAVSKALMADEWENLAWEGNVTTATMKQGKVKIKIFAVSGAADVQLYAEYTSESNMPEEKRRQVAARALRSLEKPIAESLGFDFRKARGDDPFDRAVAR